MTNQIPSFLADSIPAQTHIDFQEWAVDFLPGASVEFIEIVPGAVNLSEIYIKPGSVLDLDLVQVLESKIAL